jgi:signal transduction histidine kinase
MKSWGLRSKILMAFLMVIIGAGLVLVVTLELIAPNFYRSHAQEMARAMGQLSALQNHALQHDLEQGFNQALTQSLFLAALITVPLVVLVAAFVSSRIVLPIFLLSKASARIAAGGYQERLLRFSQDELGDLTNNFNSMAEALAQTENRRIELIGTVAHELRTPLSGLRGYTEGMLDGVFSVEHAAPRIGQEIKRLERLLDDLSNLSQVETGVIQLNIQLVRLDVIALELQAQLLPLFKQKNLVLQLELTPVLVKADPDRLFQIGYNLISNALHHTTIGTVTIQVLQEQKSAIFAVLDTGEGITATDLPHIFERFYRADKARTRDDDRVGMGIGLTIAQHLVEAMQGRISVHSQQGQGTAFRVQFDALPNATYQDLEGKNL